MASNESTRVCEAEGNACKKEVRALCFHCSKHLCRIHLMQHAQLIEDKTRTELNSLADKFNELSSRFDHVSISDDILQKPLAQLETWRTEAHEKIDRIVEEKRQEVNVELEKYRKALLTKNEEQLVKINMSRKMIAELIQEADASVKQMADLQSSIDEAEMYLDALNVPVINIIAQPSNWFVDICTNFYDAEVTTAEKMRKFKVTYIRLNGMIRHYYVKTSKDGIMNDLIQSFVLQYPLLEALAVLESNSILMTQHQPKSDLILSVEVYGHCVRKQYSNDDQLTVISRGESVVFYETPYSLNEPKSLRILMPCYFQRPSNRSTFGWPIYLSVPRKGCQGQDVRDALHDSLGKLFSLDVNTDQQLYDAYLRTTVNSRMTETELNDVLQKQIDFNKESTTVCVSIANQIVGRYEENTLG